MSVCFALQCVLIRGPATHGRCSRPARRRTTPRLVGCAPPPPHVPSRPLPRPPAHLPGSYPPITETGRELQQVRGLAWAVGKVQGRVCVCVCVCCLAKEWDKTPGGAQCLASFDAFAPAMLGTDGVHAARPTPAVPVNQPMASLSPPTHCVNAAGRAHRRLHHPQGHRGAADCVRAAPVRGPARLEARPPQPPHYLPSWFLFFCFLRGKRKKLTSVFIL